MLKRLVICSAGLCLFAFSPVLPFPARAQTEAQTPLQEAIARLTPEQQARLKAYEAARIAFQPPPLSPPPEALGAGAQQPSKQP